MTREPEPLERVRALVCEPCWVNCFDTEGFEKLGRGDINQFKYNVSVARDRYTAILPMIRMIQSGCGLRLQQSPRTLIGYNAG